LHQNHCAHKGVSDLSSNQARETMDRVNEREKKGANTFPEDCQVAPS